MIKGKKLGLIVLVLFSFFIIINVIEPTIISKFIFTMKAVSSTFSLSLTINSGIAPNITIYEPRSRFYSHGKNMMLGYTVIDDGSVSNVWFNLNNGSNITLNVDQNIFYFNASLGNNTLYIFANDTQNNLNNSVFVNFTIGRYDGHDYEINDSGGFSFNDDTVKEYFKSITGLNSSWTLNVTLHGNDTPSNWIRPSVIENEVLYFEMSANTYQDTSGDYNFYFNLSRAVLGEINPENIRVYFYNVNNWNELTTSVESSNANAVEFMAVLTHLSQFMIGEKEGGSSSSTGTGVSGEISSPNLRLSPLPQKEKTPKEPEIKKPEEKKGEIIKPKPGELIVPGTEFVKGLSLRGFVYNFLLLLALVLVIMFLLHTSYLYKGYKLKSSVNLMKHKEKFRRQSKRIFALLLSLLIIYLLGSSLTGVTGSVVKNISGNGNINLLVTLLMVVLAVFYFIKRIKTS